RLVEQGPSQMGLRALRPPPRPSPTRGEGVICSPLPPCGGGPGWGVRGRRVDLGTPPVSSRPTLDPSLVSPRNRRDAADGRATPRPRPSKAQAPAVSRIATRTVRIALLSGFLALSQESRSLSQVFPDKNLETAVRAALHLDEKAGLDDKLKNLFILEADGKE